MYNTVHDARVYYSVHDFRVYDTVCDATLYDNVYDARLYDIVCDAMVYDTVYDTLDDSKLYHTVCDAKVYDTVPGLGFLLFLISCNLHRFTFFSHACLNCEDPAFPSVLTSSLTRQHEDLVNTLHHLSFPWYPGYLSQ